MFERWWEAQVPETLQPAYIQHLHVLEGQTYRWVNRDASIGERGGGLQAVTTSF